jgi:hypothetical protein
MRHEYVPHMMNLEQSDYQVVRLSASYFRLPPMRPTRTGSY